MTSAFKNDGPRRKIAEACGVDEVDAYPDVGVAEDFAPLMWAAELELELVLPAPPEREALPSLSSSLLSASSTSFKHRIS